MRSAREPNKVTADEGTVTAEFAVAIPAVLVILSLVIGGIYLATNRLTLVAHAAEIARFEARGDEALAAERINLVGNDTTVERERVGSLLCITLSSRPVGGLLAPVTVTGKACAAIAEGASDQE